MKVKLQIKGVEVTFSRVEKDDFVCITDIAKYKNPEAPADIIKNWLRSKNTIELLGLWERLHNPNFKLVEFDQFRNEAGYNHFVLSYAMTETDQNIAQYCNELGIETPFR